MFGKTHGPEITIWRLVGGRTPPEDGIVGASRYSGKAGEPIVPQSLLRSLRQEAANWIKQRSDTDVKTGTKKRFELEL
jgi:hypothetical protein